MAKFGWLKYNKQQVKTYAIGDNLGGVELTTMATLAAGTLVKNDNGTLTEIDTFTAAGLCFIVSEDVASTDYNVALYELKDNDIDNLVAR